MVSRCFEILAVTLSHDTILQRNDASKTTATLRSEDFSETTLNHRYVSRTSRGNLLVSRSEESGQSVPDMAAVEGVRFELRQ